MKFLSLLQTFFVTTRRISLGLAVLKFTRALLSVYSVILSAEYFGASIERDTWVLAGSAVSILTQLAFGPINEVFRAKFIHIRGEEGEERALAAANSLIYMIIGVSLLIIGLVEMYPGLLSDLFAPGFRGAQSEALKLMIRWIIPALLLNQITLIWIAMLNAYRSYFIPDIYSLISGVINVLCILVLAKYVGIYSLIVANYLEMGILALILLIALQKAGKQVLVWSHPRWQLVRPFVVTSFPFYLSYLAGNAQMAIERILSTYLGVGNVSVLDYARKFIDMPTGVIVGVITTMLTPTLAELFVQKKFSEFNRESIKFMRMLILGLAPFVVLCSVCSREMVELLLVRGSFKREFIGVTAQSLRFFSLGSVGYILYAVGAQSLIAQKKAAFYAIVGTASTTVSIAMNLTLFKITGLVIFPVSWGLTLFLSGIYMVFCANSNRRETFREIVKMLSLLTLIMALGYAVRIASLQLLAGAVSDLKRHAFLVVLATAFFGNLLYLCAAYLFNLEEIQGVRHFLAGRR